MGNEQTTTDLGGSLVGAKLSPNTEQRSPLADALQALDKSLSGLEMNIESLDVSLQPLQLRQVEDSRVDTVPADRPPSSDFVNALLETAQRINRNAQKIRRINKDLEI